MKTPLRLAAVSAVLIAGGMAVHAAVVRTPVSAPIEVFLAAAVFALFTTFVVGAIRQGRTSIAFGCAMIGQTLLVLVPIVVPVSRPVRFIGIGVLVLVYLGVDRWSRRRH